MHNFSNSALTLNEPSQQNRTKKHILVFLSPFQGQLGREWFRKKEPKIMPSEVANFLSANGLQAYICIMDDQGFEDLIDLKCAAADEVTFKELVPPLGHRTKIRRLLGVLGGHVNTASAASEVTGTVSPGSVIGIATPATYEIPQITSAEPPATVTNVGNSDCNDAHPHEDISPHTTTSSHHLAAMTITPPPTAVKRTPVVEWLESNHLGAHTARLSEGGFDELSDIVALFEKVELFEHLVPMKAHRDRMKRLLAPLVAHTCTAEWVEAARLNSADDTASQTSAKIPQLSPVQHLTELFGSQYVVRAPAADALSNGSDHGRDEVEPTPVRATVASSHRGGSFAEVVKSKQTVFVSSMEESFDVALFVDNPGLSAAQRATRQGFPSGIPQLCTKECQASATCDKLHFRKFEMIFDGYGKKPVSASYVSLVTVGLLHTLRTGEPCRPCRGGEGCEQSSCSFVHLCVAIQKEANKQRDSTQRKQRREIEYQKINVEDCCTTAGLIQMLEHPIPHHRKSWTIRLCSKFSCCQTCPSGSFCNNIHIVHSGTARYFYANSPIDQLQKHVASTVEHVPQTNWDLGKRCLRTCRRFDVSELLDFMLYTECRGCALICFDVFRKHATRHGMDVLWAVLQRLRAYRHRDDPALAEHVKLINSILQLKFHEQVRLTSSVHQLVRRMSEAMTENLRLRQADHSTHVSGKYSNAVSYVFWDFDNVMLTERADLHLFYHSLVHFLWREGRASGKNAVYAKAFGLQQSFDDEIVDALRDIQVEMVLCSSKKQEETDRVMERSMRSVEVRPNTTIVVVSSDQDFGSVVKDLGAKGIHMIVVHGAERDSQHERVISMASSQSVQVFEIYASALESRMRSGKKARHTEQNVPATRESASQAAGAVGFGKQPAPAAAGGSGGGVGESAPVADDDDDDIVVAPKSPSVKSTSPTPPKRSSPHSMVVNVKAATLHPNSETADPQPKSVLELFGDSMVKRFAPSVHQDATIKPRSSEESPGTSEASSVVSDIIRRNQQQRAKSYDATPDACAAPSHFSGNVADLLHGKLKNAVLGSQVPITAAPASLAASASSGIRPSSSLTSFVAAPAPLDDHPVWYAFIGDVYFVRVQDRQHKGELTGPLDPRATEQTVMRDIRMFLEMCSLRQGFLPPWFSKERCLRSMFHRAMNIPSTEWLNDAHYNETYFAHQLLLVFQTLREIAIDVDGPLELGPSATKRSADRQPISLRTK